jgi:hypothetical protein
MKRSSTSEKAIIPTRPPGLERHYKISEIAEQWGLTAPIVRRLFRGEPGVLAIRHRDRRYAVFRIPHSVLVRVQERLMAKGPAAA